MLALQEHRLSWEARLGYDITHKHFMLLVTKLSDATSTKQHKHDVTWGYWLLFHLRWFSISKCTEREIILANSVFLRILCDVFVRRKKRHFLRLTHQQWLMLYNSCSHINIWELIKNVCLKAQKDTPSAPVDLLTFWVYTSCICVSLHLYTAVVLWCTCTQDCCS